MAREESKQKETQRQEGSGELSKWHAERKENITKKKAANRTEEAQSEEARKEALKPGANPWELVSSLIDQSARTVDETHTDTSRMRALLIQLKTAPPAAM